MVYSELLEQLIQDKGVLKFKLKPTLTCGAVGSVAWCEEQW